MIRFASFKPEFFNANGDQANLEVLQKQLAWRGVESSVSDHGLETCDLLLVGDGSRAAMRHFAAELADLSQTLQHRLDAGMPTLLVGSAHDFFAGRVCGLPAIHKTERKSEFRDVSFEGISAFGYRNSEADSDLFIAGGFVSTTLFGPVLAKSPQLLDHFLRALGVTQELPGDLKDELALLVQQIKTRAISG